MQHYDRLKPKSYASAICHLKNPVYRSTKTDPGGGKLHLSDVIIESRRKVLASLAERPLHDTTVTYVRMDSQKTDRETETDRDRQIERYIDRFTGAVLTEHMHIT